MYKQIEGMMSASEAADALVFHATNIASAINRNDNTVFDFRKSSLNAVLKLLNQYVQQELSTQSATVQSASQKQVIMMSGKKNNSHAEAQDVLAGLKAVPGFLAGYIDEKEYRVVSFHEDAQPSSTLCAGQKRVDFSLAA